MVARSLQSRRQMALAGFLAGLVATLFVGVVAFGDPLLDVLPRAVASGLGLGIGFYVLGPPADDSEAVE